MAFTSNHDDEEVMSEINMTPLVDVMLVLLIIFMLTVPVLTHSVNVDLPRAGSTTAEITPETVTIAVDAEGRIFWDEDLLDERALKARLAAAAVATPQPQIYIYGDRRADYEHVIRVMAKAQEAGLTQLGFVTEIGD